MRDYSFGNFISTLRERKGLSQYQLGVLVGVSDKAVSKWENGASKPRTNIIRRLSEILDVSVDELLTCEYATFNSERKDLFAMKKEIMELAEHRLEDLYGDTIPVSIENRFKTEKLMLGTDDALLWMGFLGKLQKHFSEKDIYLELRKPQTQASFIAWLLGCTDVNPLPAHYYCPNCKKVEFVYEAKCGLDLPDKKCSCGTRYRKDGFAVDAMNMYPIGKWYEVHVPKTGMEAAKECLDKYFAGYGTLHELEIEGDGDAPSTPKISRYVLISADQDKRYPGGTLNVSPKEYLSIMREMSGVTFFENNEAQLGNIYGKNLDCSREQLQGFFDYAVRNGYFRDRHRNIYPGKLIDRISNPKFSDIVYILGIVCGTGTWEENAEALIDEGIALDALITCREDVYSYLYKMLNGKCYDTPSGQVYEMKENLRMGRYSNDRMPAETEKLLLECDVPKWYVESMKKIRYLFPKTYLITMLKRDIMKYLADRGDCD